MRALKEADMLIIAGASLNVFPAAGLVNNTAPATDGIFISIKFIQSDLVDFFNPLHQMISQVLLITDEGH